MDRQTRPVNIAYQDGCTKTPLQLPHELSGLTSMRSH